MPKNKLQQDAENELFDESDSEGEPEGVDDDEGSEPIEEGETIEVESRSSRKDRRRDRFRDMAGVGELEERLNQRLAGLEQLLTRQQPQQQQPQQQSGPPPQIERINHALKELYEQQDTLTSAWSAKVQTGASAEEISGFTKKARALQEKREELVAMRVAVQMGVGRQQHVPDAREMQQEIIRQQTRTRHSDIFGHTDSDRILRWTQGYFDQRVAEGAVDSQELQDEAMEAARSKFGLNSRHQRTRPAPSRSEKARLGGTGGGSGRQPERQQVVVTKEMRKMAQMAFGHIKDERKRLEHYVALQKGKK